MFCVIDGAGVTPYQLFYRILAKLSSNRSKVSVHSTASYRKIFIVVSVPPAIRAGGYV